MAFFWGASPKSFITLSHGVRVYSGDKKKVGKFTCLFFWTQAIKKSGENSCVQFSVNATTVDSLREPKSAWDWEARGAALGSCGVRSRRPGFRRRLAAFEKKHLTDEKTGYPPHSPGRALDRRGRRFEQQEGGGLGAGKERKVSPGWCGVGRGRERLGSAG